MRLPTLKSLFQDEWEDPAFQKAIMGGLIAALVFCALTQARKAVGI
jgi:hypothetical protein